jgi:hypothetical protein
MAKATRRPREPAARACKAKPAAKGNVPKAHVPKAGHHKRQASNGTDDDSTSNEEVLVPRRRKKAKPAQAVKEVDDDFDKPEIEVVENGASGEESNEVLCCNDNQFKYSP